MKLFLVSLIIYSSSCALAKDPAESSILSTVLLPPQASSSLKPTESLAPTAIEQKHKISSRSADKNPDLLKASAAPEDSQESPEDSQDTSVEASTAKNAPNSTKLPRQSNSHDSRNVTTKVKHDRIQACSGRIGFVKATYEKEGH